MNSKDILIGLGGLWACSFLSGVAYGETVTDYTKTVIKQIPYSVEVCTEGNGKSEVQNFLEGAIVGGAIGNNIPGEKNGGALGAFLGGVLNTESNKGTKCRTETRYEEEMSTVYSHSVVTFYHNGKEYKLRFQK